MKTWKHFTSVAIIAIFSIVVTFTACDDKITTLTTYDSVTIEIPTTKADTVKSLFELVDSNNVNIVTIDLVDYTIIDRTFVSSGAQFTATVNGSNNPIQTVTWEITSMGHKSRTTINTSTGVLSIADDEYHGKEITIKATSTIDTNKFNTITVSVVQCLPSDFFGTWNGDWTMAINANLLNYDDNVIINNPVWIVADNTIEAMINEYHYGFGIGGINGSDGGMFFRPHFINATKNAIAVGYGIFTKL